MSIFRRLLDSDAMTGRALKGLLVALTVVLGACSTDDLPLIGKPAASLDGHTVSMADYKTRLKLYQDAYKLDQSAQPSPGPSLDSAAGKHTEQQLEDRAVRDLVDEIVIRDDAGKEGIKVTDDDVNAEVDRLRTAYDQQAAQSTSATKPPTFNQELQREGYSIDRFRDQLRDRFYEQRLENKMANARANNALAQIKGGKDFAEVARTYNDSASGQSNSEFTLGASDFSSIDPKVRPAIDALQPGQLADKVAVGSNGLWIFKLISRDANGVRMMGIFIVAPEISVYRASLRPKWFSDHISGLERAAHVKYNVGSRAS